MNDLTKAVIEDLNYLISEDCADTQTDYKDEIKFAIKLMEERELYSWHFTHNDPDDVPNLESLCLVYGEDSIAKWLNGNCENESEIIEPAERYFLCKYTLINNKPHWDALPDDNIIAWKYIEPVNYTN